MISSFDMLGPWFSFLFIFMTISILFWNVQGAASGNFRRSFKTVAKNYKLSMVVVMEPRVSGMKADEFIKKSGFDNSHRVEGVSLEEFGSFGEILQRWRFCLIMGNLFISEFV